jgi:rubrerythrin
MGTMDNLAAAFAGESQANRKYLAFAAKADKDGYPEVAKLFRAAAEAETVHAHAHLKVMKGVQGTAENLQGAIDGEGYEFQTMYPDFLKVAEQEDNDAAITSFKNAMAVEEIHHGLYNKALDAVKKGKDLPAAKLFVCPICGNTVENKIPGKCPVCGADGAKFVEIK